MPSKTKHQSFNHPTHLEAKELFIKTCTTSVTSSWCINPFNQGLKSSVTKGVCIDPMNITWTVWLVPMEWEETWWWTWMRDALNKRHCKGTTTSESEDIWNMFLFPNLYSFNWYLGSDFPPATPLPHPGLCETPCYHYWSIHVRPSSNLQVKTRNLQISMCYQLLVDLVVVAVVVVV